MLGRAAFREGDYAGAEVSFRESLRLLQPVGMTWLISQALLALAWVAYAHPVGAEPSEPALRLG